jgi:hypothetical protein
VNPLQVVHYWISLAALGVLLLAAVALISGILMPKLSKRGDALVKFGAWTASMTCVIYLVYAATAITTVVVMRS